MKKQSRIHRAKPKKYRPAKQRSIVSSGFARGLPVDSSMAGKNIFENGLGNVIISRKFPDGSLIVGIFLVDVYCLGVKDATLMKMSRHEYEGMLQMAASADSLEDIKPCCLKKLVTESVKYAANIGIAPHKDYKEAATLLEDIDCSECAAVYEFGCNGKPFYISGPNETPARIRQVNETLRKHCGAGGYDFMNAMDEQDSDDLIRDYFIDDPSEVEALMDEMDEGLPFSAQIHPDIFNRMRTQYDGLQQVTPNVQVIDISYAGDSGGIICEIDFDKDAGENVMLLSLTHLMPDKQLPFYNAIFKYQKRRVDKLQKQGQLDSRFLDLESA